jgi:hypothetical protein
MGMGIHLVWVELYTHGYRYAGAGTGFRQWVFKVTEKIKNMRGFRN